MKGRGTLFPQGRIFPSPWYPLHFQGEEPGRRPFGMTFKSHFESAKDEKLFHPPEALRLDHHIINAVCQGFSPVILQLKGCAHTGWLVGINPSGHFPESQSEKVRFEISRVTRHLESDRPSRCGIRVKHRRGWGPGGGRRGGESGGPAGRRRGGLGG